jgi:short-subunit dehydrogenase
MSKSIAVLGAGPGLGQAVAGRFAAEGYDVVVVARRREPLERIAEELHDRGRVHIICADLADPASVPALVDQVRAAVGVIDVLYYAPTPDGGFVPAADLTSEQAATFMPLTFYTLVELVHEFLPGMVERGGGAILTAQGASSTFGQPNRSGPGPAQAAQRNYLQSLHAELDDKGVHVGMLYVGAVIENSAFHTWISQDPTGAEAWGPTVHPDVLADLLWTMQLEGGEAEVQFPLPSAGAEAPVSRPTH